MRLHLGDPLVVVAILGLVVTALLGGAVASGLAAPIDAAIIAVVRGPELETLLAPLRLITELGSTWAVTAVAVGVLVAGAAMERPALGAVGAGTITLAALANAGLKRLTGRERPSILEPIIVDGNDPDAMLEVARRTVDRARGGGGPSLVEAKTYRQGGHSRADPGNYRPADEVEEWLARDPIPMFRQQLPKASGAAGNVQHASGTPRNRQRR